MPFKTKLLKGGESRNINYSDTSERRGLRSISINGDATAL